MKKQHRKRITAALAAITVLAGGMSFPAFRGGTASAAMTDPRLTIDFNANDGRTASYSKHAENWVVVNGSSASTKINGITLKLSNGGSVGSGIKGVNYKGLQKNDGSTPTLTMDGVTIDGGEKGGAIKLEISGLSAGTHSIKTYHSCVDDATCGTLSVSINGSTAATGVKCPTRVTNEEDAGLAYGEFTVTSGQTVTVLVKSESSSMAWLNGIEIDGADPIKGVSRISPANHDTHHEAEKGLSWTAGSGAVSHDVYLGTDFESVYKADHSSAVFKGNQSGTSYALSDYTTLNTYYWRVDEIDSSGNVTKGAVNFYQTARLAFPTAEGYGRYARGGRGGTVYHVTNLNDSGAGSLRYGVESVSGPRTIVFDVGGIISLQSKIVFTDSNGECYIAGQTAPGEGITLLNWTLGSQGTNDVIIRDVHLRLGDSNGKGTDGMGLTSSNHCIIDHCSISWGTDEGFSSRYAQNITFQWNIIAEGLNKSVHYDGNDRTKTEPHAFAASISGDVGSFHHNLLVHNTDRNWSLAGGMSQDNKGYNGSLDIVNNVVYNWVGRCTDGGIGRVNFYNNFYKQGPESGKSTRMIAISDSALERPMKAYVEGNIISDISGNYVLKATDDAWKAGRAEATNAQTEAETCVNAPMWESHINAETAEQAYKSVLANAGANAQGRDQWDTRYVKEVTNGTYTYTGSVDKRKGIIDSQKDVGGYPTSSTFKGGSRDSSYDTDKDGMSDAWETAHGLNPKDASDGAIVSLSGDDYTNLELFLNELAGDAVEYNGGSGKRGAVMDTAPKYEITNAATGALLENAERWTLKAGDSGYYQIINAATGANLSGDEQYKFVKSGDGYIIYTKSSDDEACVGGEGTVWKLTPKLDPITGKLISSVDVLDTEYYASWAVDTSAASGDAVFGDRAAEKCGIATLPANLSGAELILTPCDAKASNAEQATLTAAQSITLYVGLDSRVTAVPAWLSAWTKESGTITTTNEVTFNLYSMKLGTGDTVTLGANGQSSGCMNYIVLASAGSGTIIGDVNLNGTVELADAVALQQFLLTEKALTAEQGAQADMDGNRRLNAVDLTLLKRMLLQ